MFDVLGDDFRVCLPSGNLVRLAPPAFLYYEPPGDMLDFNDYSGGFPDHYEARETISRRVFTYIDVDSGMLREEETEWHRAIPHLQGHLCIATDRIPVKMKDLPNWLSSEAKHRYETRFQSAADYEEIRGLPARIAEAYRTGRVKTKDEAAMIFRRDLKTEPWRQVLREAAEIEPMVSKPGVRKSEN